MSWASWRRSFGAVGNLPFSVPFSYPKLVPFLEPNGKILILGQLSFGSVFGTLRLQISAPCAPKRSFQGGGGLSKHTLHPTCLYDCFGSFLARRSCIGAGLVG